MAGHDRGRRIARLNRMADLLDTRFSILGLRFGWDSIVGLGPGLGDAITAIPGIYVIYEAARLGARRRVLARMALNTGLDMTLGSVPLLGDAFDLLFKSHRRNVALLMRDLAHQDAARAQAA